VTEWVSGRMSLFFCALTVGYSGNGASAMRRFAEIILLVGTSDESSNDDDQRAARCEWSPNRTHEKSQFVHSAGPERERGESFRQCLYAS